MEVFNPDLLLPQELSIDSVDEHLYRIGLCLTPNRHNTRRSLIFHPILITILSTIFAIERIASIFTDKRWLLFLIGDISQFFGMKIYINMLFILVSSYIMLNQLIYYYNNKRDIRPTFLTLFQVMSGSVSPASIGLTDEEQVNKLLKLTRNLLTFVKYQCQYIVPLCIASVIILLFIMFTSIIEVLLYGIPTTIMYLFVELYFWNFLGYQYLYFYLLCKYLDRKLKNCNDKLILMIKSKCPIEIANTLHTYNPIYREIKEYDSTYIW